MTKFGICLALLSVLLVSGCHTIYNSAKGAGAATYFVGKGIATDACATYSTVYKADKWFQENYW
ncbi:MAG: hypothetical protein GF333_03665 [Candidatus Omnitrophica bacterium]|nr:hypothetical protein [Candidatus Omnitrophota bacterium]